MKTALYIVVGLVLLIGILTMVAPTKMNIKRSVVINAPQEVVFENISSQHNLHKWYPWDRKDPNIKLTFEGQEGAVGETSKWESEVVGQGDQTITAIEPGKQVNTHIHFIKPWDSQADGIFIVNDTAGATKVTRELQSAMPRPMNIMGLFMDMDKAVGKDFEEGLGYLKELSEKEAMNVEKKYRGFDISEKMMEAKTYVGKKGTVAFKDIAKFYGDNLPKIGEAVQREKLEVTGAPSGIYYTYDTVKMTTDMAAVFPVKEVKSPLTGWDVINVPAGKAVELDYYGNYDKMQNAYDAIEDYLEEKGLKSKSMSVEEYVTDPMTEKDTAKWVTKIYYYFE